METFSALVAFCTGNSPVTGEFPAQRTVTQSFDVFFDLRPNKRLSKQWWGGRFETPLRPLWRHSNVCSNTQYIPSIIHTVQALLCYGCYQPILPYPSAIFPRWDRGPFCIHGLTSIPARMNSYIHYKVWDAGWEWITNFSLQFTGHVMTSIPGIKLIHISKEGPCAFSSSGYTQTSQITKFIGPTWGSPGSCRPQMGPMLSPWTLLSGMSFAGWHHHRDCVEATPVVGSIVMDLAGRWFSMYIYLCPKIVTLLSGDACMCQRIGSSV